MRAALKIYFGVVIIAAAAFLIAVDWAAIGQLNIRDLVGLGVFVLLAALSAHMAVESLSGRQFRSSIAFLPLLALVVLFPTPAVVVAVTGTWLIDIRRGRSWYVTVFNLSQLILAYGIASQVFSWARGTPPGVGLGEDVRSFLSVFVPFCAAAITFFALNIILVSIGFAVKDRQRLYAVVAEMIGRGGTNIFYDVLASPVAVLAAYLYWEFHIAGLLVVVFPLLLIRYSYLSALQLERANRDLLRVLIKAIETRDPYTSGHSLRVSNLARMIALDFGLRPRIAGNVETAALLHDIGKIEALYADIISKKSELTEAERAIIRTHATKGADLLQSLTSLNKNVVVGVRHHHERYDGSGYPNGMAGKEIPIAARIIMISDAVDAMLSDRPYREALPIGTVRTELVRCSGTQFDPDLVDAILRSNTLERAELLVERSGARAAQLRAVAS